MAKIKYRLGLDLGTNSLGWCAYRLDDSGDSIGILRLGSRIFSDGRNPKDLASNAAVRRAARQARRRRDRVLKRRARIMNALIEHGLMPSDDVGRKAIQQADPYVLRKRGLDEQLTLFELGRAIYHLARKRGFKSSRKDRSNADAEKESGKVNKAVSALKAKIKEANCRSAGEYLANEHHNGRPVRARQTADGQYVLYMQRDMVIEEFELLWKSQLPFYPNILSESVFSYLKDSILFQRKLLPVKPGKCLFEPEEYRAPLASTLQQEFRILQELNNLRVKDGIDSRNLALEERDAMFHALNAAAKQITFANLAKAAGLQNAKAFNLESEKRKGLNGNSTRAQFIAPATFNEKWDSFSQDLKEALTLLVSRASDNDALEASLIALPDLLLAKEIFRPHEHERACFETLANIGMSISRETAKAICDINLKDDYASISIKALAKIVPELKKSVLTYDKAVQNAGYSHHSQFYTGEFFGKLPYYGQILQSYTSPADKAKVDHERQYGKIANPTVHIGLNQLRQLVNALIKRYGHPHEIVIELTREFGASGEKRREITKQQSDNQKRNDSYNAKLEKLSQRQNRENRQKLLLWDELGKDDALDRYCVYSGKRLSMAALFSDEIEIDHILPFSRSLNDGIGNKILCTRQSNRDKGNKTPFEAWGHTDRWPSIMERAARLPGRKPGLFKENALEVFLGDTDFLDRHLTDTAYFSRVAKQYLSAVCPPNCIWVSTGRLTGMLRSKWGLNGLLSDSAEKNRNDHRHHALDAAVIAACTRSIIKTVSDAARRSEMEGADRVLSRLDYPWPTFRPDLQSCLERIVVSHKIDHGVETALHNDTNYGLVELASEKFKQPLVARYVPISTVTEKDLDAISDVRVQSELTELFSKFQKTTDIKAAIAAFSEKSGIRRVRKQERLAVIPIHDRRNGNPYRYVKGDGNYCYEIYVNEKGKWAGNVISNFEANQVTYNPTSVTTVNNKPLIMRIRKGDILSLQFGDIQKLYRVAFFTDGKIGFAEPHEGNVDKRARDKTLPYLFKSPSSLQATEANIVCVDILGYVNRRRS